MQKEHQVLVTVAEAIDGFSATAEEAANVMLAAASKLSQQVTQMRLAVDKLDEKINRVDATIQTSVSGCLNDSVTKASERILNNIGSANRVAAQAADRLNNAASGLTAKLLVISLGGGFMGCLLALLLFQFGIQ